MERRQRRARSLVGGERRRRSTLVRDTASDLGGVRDTASDLGVVGRAPDSVSESTDSDLGPRPMTRGGEKRSTLSRVRTFLRREKKEKQMEEESRGKTGSKTR